MMDSEKLASEAKKRHDDLIEQAYRQAESAQERTRALEERREELMVELETVRSTLTRLEGTLEERREDLELSSASTSVKVVPARTEPDEKTWELGETVRVIPPFERPPSEPAGPSPERPRAPREPAPDPSADVPDELRSEEAPALQPEPAREEIEEREPVGEPRSGAGARARTGGPPRRCRCPLPRSGLATGDDHGAHGSEPRSRRSRGNGRLSARGRSTPASSSRNGMPGSSRSPTAP